MRRIVGFLLAGCWFFIPGFLGAEELQEEQSQWQRIDSRYCTIWLHAELNVRRVNRQVSIWMIRPQVKVDRLASDEEQLAAKCDTLFFRAEQLLDMYPPDVHVTLRVLKSTREIGDLHAARYGVGTEAIAFYILEDNTIYASAGDLSESVLVHEMAHCIVDHYFGIRPPRKIEEMLAMYVDKHLQD